VSDLKERLLPVWEREIIEFCSQEKKREKKRVTPSKVRWGGASRNQYSNSLIGRCKGGVPREAGHQGIGMIGGRASKQKRNREQKDSTQKKSRQQAQSVVPSAQRLKPGGSISGQNKVSSWEDRGGEKIREIFWISRKETSTDRRDKEKKNDRARGHNGR